MSEKSIYQITGAMSGTSLDGLDMAFCIFERQGEKWDFRIEAAQTVDYPDGWKQRLLEMEEASAVDFCQTDRELGHFMGEKICEFHQKNGLAPQFVASHGHTIFHQPDKKFTVQIGHGAAIAQETGLPVIADFRSGDVANGGQGAPLVPIGDELLFGQYAACLNLGGIANLSAKKGNNRLSWDTSACNMALNHLAGKMGKAYDENGKMAASGTFQPQLFQELNQLPYFQLPPPKSLGKEWFLAHMLPLLENSSYSLPDIACTVVHHIAFQVKAALTFLDVQQGEMLVTGGGAFHRFLLQQLATYCRPITIALPLKQLIEYKEALVFAFLGLRRMRGETNCLQSVTGAAKDTVGGAVYLP